MWTPDGLAFTSLGSSTSLPLPLVLGHFLPWFTRDASRFPLSRARTSTIAALPSLENNRHWMDPRSGYRRCHLHLPEIGTYDSRDPRVIAWQIERARAAGLDGFIINWYGQNSAENVITLAVLDGIDAWNYRHPERPFLYFLSVDSQSLHPTEGKVPVSLEEDFQYIQNYLMRPGYLLREGRPVFSCFPYDADVESWLEALNKVFGSESYDFLWCNRAAGVGETGCYAWVHPDDCTVDTRQPYSWVDPDNAGTHFASSLYSQWNHLDYGHQYGMAGVWPGFDDQLVAWAWKPAASHAHVRPRVIAREGTAGNTYERLWQIYFDYLARWRCGEFKLPLSLVQVVTWNDYAEATTIEPTRDYGNRYIELTAKAVAQARLLWSASLPSFPASIS